MMSKVIGEKVEALISEEYRELNRALHEESPQYGTSSHRWADAIEALAQQCAVTDILDYGAGKQTLARALAARRIRPYDPAIPELSADPEPADMVVCTDVLEHVEPHLIENVIGHIASLARTCCFLVIPTGPASKTLRDGRNAHLIQKPLDWWLARLCPHFSIVYLDHHGGDICLALVPARSATAASRQLTDAAVSAARVGRVLHASMSAELLLIERRPASRLLRLALKLLRELLYAEGGKRADRAGISRTCIAASGLRVTTLWTY